MKILILTQYFPPETGAPQNRLYEMAVRLQKKGADITILTAMPNYPQMEIYQPYKGKMYAAEDMNGLKVHRAFIYVSKNKSIFFRLLNYFSFVISSFFVGLFKINKNDFLICESPPLFLGITAYFLSKIKRSKLIFNVSDLWPESAEKLGLVKNKTLLSTSTYLEEFIYKKSLFVTGQTKGIVNNILKRIPDKKVFWVPNGADLKFYNANQVFSDWRNQNGFDTDDILFLYAGIIGHAQGLEVILKAANKLKADKRLKFILIGSGPEKGSLINLKNALELKNVFFYEPVNKELMPSIIQSCNAGIIPLKKLELFLGAIPSKIFELLAMEKPLLLGVDGEAKELFIDEAKSGLFFIPEDDADLAERIKRIVSDPSEMMEMGKRGRKYVNEKFNRDKIADDLFATMSLYFS